MDGMGSWKAVEGMLRNFSPSTGRLAQGYPHNHQHEAEHNETGTIGEELAARFLEGQGYDVLHRNWRHGRHEIDLVARHGQVLVVVEVKTRSNEQHGEPYEAVKKGKRGKLIKAANAYVAETGCELCLRFDIVSVILHPGGKPYIHHIPDAFYPTVHDRAQ